jgi:transcriptional regulator with XRE-family HTH domain
MAKQSGDSADPGRLAFGVRVRHLRLERGLSQERLAEVAGIHRTYMSDIERGERNIGLDNILALARALDVSAAEFFRRG